MTKREKTFNNNCIYNQQSKPLQIFLPKPSNTRSVTMDAKRHNTQNGGTNPLIRPLTSGTLSPTITS